jgi:cytochrome P450
MASQIQQQPTIPDMHPLKAGLDIQFKGALPFYLDLWRRYGDFVHMDMKQFDMYFVCHPDDLRTMFIHNMNDYYKGKTLNTLRKSLGMGLFTSDGDLWRKQRRLMQPLFTPRAVERYADTMIGVTARLLQDWRKQTQAGAPIMSNKEMLRLALNIISQAMFNIDLDGADARAEFSQVAKDFGEVLHYVTYNSGGAISLPLWLPLPANLRFKQSNARLQTFMMKFITECRRNPEQAGILINLLLSAQDPETNQQMSEQQLYDEVVTIFFAGHETTAQTLTFALHLISQHPEVQARLHAEVDQVLGDRTPTLADAHQLNYARMVVQETMRLYPSVSLAPRDVLHDTQMRDHTIKQGSLVIFSAYITHRMEAFWPDPERFDPLRFTPEQEKERHPYAYLPFSQGQRICIGNNFALLESTFALAMIMQHVKIEYKEAIQPQVKMVGTLHPDREIPLYLTWRR